MESLAIGSHPIDRIEWRPAGQLTANSYNPNVVFVAELRLLALSILPTGWIQPILADGTGEIIDGYHRWWLVQNNPEVSAMTGGQVPVATLDLSVPERMMLTIRINRAKGSHQAVKMHDIVAELVNVYGLNLEDIGKKIGASKAEVELLLMEDVFKKLEIGKHTYSKAWYPRTKGVPAPALAGEEKGDS